MALEITDANFEEVVLKSDKPVLVDFWAEWCGPCRMVGPVVDEISREYEGKAIVGKVNVDNNPQISTQFGIRNIPALLYFKGGEVVDKQVGAVPKSVLAGKLDKQFMQPPIDHQYLSALDNLELLARQVVEGFITGLHKSPFHGFSVEFAEHRPYNAGDNVKNIDWKLFAKTDKLYSRRYEEETNLRCQFVVDISSSMYFPDQKYNKLRFSVQSVAALIFLLKRQRDAFGLTLFSDHVVLNTAAKSTGAHQKYLFSHLEEVLKTESLKIQTNLSHALHEVAELIHKRSLVVVFSDLMDTVRSEEKTTKLFSALQHLKFNKHEVILFNVTDKAKEVNFEFDHKPYLNLSGTNAGIQTLGRAQMCTV
eukprot:gene3050-3498_t